MTDDPETRAKEAMELFRAGLISQNEYRHRIGITRRAIDQAEENIFLQGKIEASKN